MLQKSKTYNVTKLKNLKFDKTQKLKKNTKLSNSNKKILQNKI